MGRSRRSWRRRKHDPYILYKIFLDKTKREFSVLNLNTVYPDRYHTYKQKLKRHLDNQVFESQHCFREKKRPDFYPDS